jgi:Fic family protein
VKRHVLFEELDTLVRGVATQQPLSGNLKAIILFNAATVKIGPRSQQEMRKWFASRHPEKQVPESNRCEGVGGQQRSKALQLCYSDARKSMQAWAALAEPLTPSVLIQLNATLRGLPADEHDKVLCHFPNKIHRADMTTVRYVGAPPELLPQLLQDFCDWLNNGFEGPQSPNEIAILKALLSQFALCQIHPFFDGNGRTSRAVLTALLLRHGFDLQIPALELMYVWDRRAYEDAFLIQPDFDMPLNMERTIKWLERMVSETRRAMELRLKATTAIKAQSMMAGMFNGAKAA